MQELLLVTHCAPTLAGMKTGNLFNCRYSDRGQLERTVESWNQMFGRKGLSVRILKAEDERALIYVYRQNRLEKDLADERVREFLQKQGYPFVTGKSRRSENMPEHAGSTDKISMDGMLEHLAERIKGNAEFPHEIGLFLGYPFEDVKGFIENRGQNCKCVGCWKVYTDECAAQRLFEKYQWCTEVYCRKFREGIPIQQLVVSVQAG